VARPVPVRERPPMAGQLSPGALSHDGDER
jgi:hypothetical protein